MGVSIFHIPLMFAEVNIPVIVVLTKYDLLVMEYHRTCGRELSVAIKKEEARNRAKRSFSDVTKQLKELKVPFVPVSTRKEALKEYGGL